MTSCGKRYNKSNIHNLLEIIIIIDGVACYQIIGPIIIMICASRYIIIL